MNQHDYANKVTQLAAGGADKVTELVDLTIGAAVGLGASDIHLEAGSSSIMVRLRLDGVMHDFGELPRELASNIVARCKVMAGLLSYRSDIPQEGGASGKTYAPGIELRISTFPTLHGERVAIRIFDPTGRDLSLEQLGFPAHVYSAMIAALSGTEGLVLLAGPCGAGKTTTLYAALRYILQACDHGRSIVTVEDPVENEIAGVTQTSVRPAVGLTFARSLRSLLRQDPEVIMVGEVRDTETAAITTEAALTGHLVLSTVHAGRAAMVPHRLLDMGTQPYALAGALRLVVAQRLVRLLCDKCKQPGPDNKNSCEPIGCADCHGTGYQGRGLLAESLPASSALHEAIMAKAARDTFAHIAREGGQDLEALACQRVEQGMTSEVEVRRVLVN